MDQSSKFDTFLPKLGDLYRHIRRPDEALKFYDRFLNQFEADYETWTRRGDCLCNLGRFDDAAESYRKALAFRPDFQPALTNLTRIRGGLADFQNQMEPGATRH
jgi:tetratricopeptide (TPR) repeat protein